MQRVKIPERPRNERRGGTDGDQYSRAEDRSRHQSAVRLARSSDCAAAARGDIRRSLPARFRRRAEAGSLHRWRVRSRARPSGVELPGVAISPTAQPAESQVEGQRGEENLQRLRQGGRGIVGEKRTERSQQERSLCGSLGKQPARHVGNQEARRQVEQDLHQQDCPKVPDSKQSEDRRQKRGISRQPGERRA